MPSCHRMVTLSCSVHKLNIIFRISGLVFHFSLLLWPPIVVVLTNYNRGSYASRNSYKTPRQPLTFCIFSSSASGDPVGPLQITKATMWIFSSWTPIIVQGPSSGCIHRGKMDVIYGWKCCIQLTSASSSETEVSLNWMAVYGIDRRPWHCLVFSSIYTITISSPK